MVAVSGGLIFLGYQLMVYGWSQVQKSNAGFFDILWPGRYKGEFPDPPNTPVTPPPPPALAGPKTPGGVHPPPIPKNYSGLNL